MRSAELIDNVKSSFHSGSEGGTSRSINEARIFHRSSPNWRFLGVRDYSGIAHINNAIVVLNFTDGR